MENNKRAKEMLTLYLTGKSLEQVGRAYGITRERVRQLITGFDEYKNREHNNSKFVKVVKNCPVCGDKFYYDPKRIYCSMACRKEATKRYWDSLKTKVCSVCGKRKAVSEYFQHKGYCTKYYSHCKACHYEYIKDWGNRNPDKKKEINKRATTKYYLKKRKACKDSKKC